MKEKVFVLSAKRYNFTDDKSGEVKMGTTVYYVNNIDPVSPGSDGQKGVVPVKANFPYGSYEQFDKLPAWFNVDYTLSANSRGQAKLIYNSVTKA